MGDGDHDQACPGDPSESMFLPRDARRESRTTCTESRAAASAETRRRGEMTLAPFYSIAIGSHRRGLCAYLVQVSTDDIADRDCVLVLRFLCNLAVFNEVHDKGYRKMLPVCYHSRRGQGSRCGLPRQTSQIGTRSASHSISSLPLLCGTERMKHFPCTAKARCRDEAG